ncbi:MAG: 4-hydroxy-tetrahydrodipicolinate synthase [Clostridia bacterium]|nr:4-hydroxy-tetrahydrodipicolinate synthase [Clostridia bacterium]
MKKTVFKGAGVAIVTPFTAEGKVDFAKLDELVEYQIANGTDAIVVCGTTGESSTLDDAEHVKCIEAVVKRVDRRVPVIAGTGSNDTNYAIKLHREAQRLGADAGLSVTPYYNKASQEGLYRHFSAIADSCDLPVILYNVPGRTGTNIKPETYARLSYHENIVGIKEANGDMHALSQTVNLCEGRLDIYSGEDSLIVPILSIGGSGVISVLSNVAPRETHDICQLWFDGKIRESAALQLKYLQLIDALFCDVNPIPAKQALNMMGWNVGECRLPLCEMSAAGKAQLETALRGVGLLK